ncbi:serine hydrolase domain-containing protein [Erythrobacter ani]|uniref:Beta-lactamase family protein n=1 Tax=Erythrobacter ani TaxID=2827235 RepID=A0ABS6SJR8_9SPHN|nr:serine hydrolase domain-containing protein [Erythrobacter ani]MBV7265258.1 beta-lactamase family protein [Erythrobacter ani]
MRVAQDPGAAFLGALLIALLLAGAGEATAGSVAAATNHTMPTVCETDELRLPPEFDRRLDLRLTELTDEMIDHGIAPGAVLMIEQDGVLVYSHASGLADAEDGRAMADDALFRLYSMTKPVTSIAALRLASSEALHLRDPVSKFIPEFAAVRTANGSVSRPVTIADLLTHQAGIIYRTDTERSGGELYRARGIPAGPGVDAPPTDGGAPITTSADLSGAIAGIALANDPGEAFTYGNATDVLGHVIEVVTGQSLGEALDDLVFVPLGMTDTAFYVPQDRWHLLTSAYTAASQFPEETRAVLSGVDRERLGPAKLTKVDDDESSIFLTRPAIEYGGAGLVGSGRDYLKFMRGVRTGLDRAGHPLLTPEIARLTRSNHLTRAARADAQYLDGLAFTYGFALKMRPTTDHPVFPKCGLFWGGAASTYFWIDPDGRTSGVFMTQVFGGDVKSYFIEMVRAIYDQ